MSQSHHKAQTSFEMVIVATLVIIVILGALRLVPTIAVSTGKIAVLKSEALRVLNKQDKFYYIADIEEPVTFEPQEKITIVIGGNTAGPGLIGELQALNQKLVDEKFYSDVDEVRIEVEQA